ncbi:DEAD/DEAH box helicase [Spongiactinospora rosea]
MTPSASSSHRADALLGRLLALTARRERVTHVEHVPARQAGQARWPDWTPEPLVSALRPLGVTGLWPHQYEAAEHAHRGQNVIISTGTGSGKSLAYLVPALTEVLDGGTVLYLTPTKALAADQLQNLKALHLGKLRAACYDGDTPFEERGWVRQHANYVLTNPDMLHRTLLPRHAQWSSFWRRLRMVVVDECHGYRGVFGSHVAQILRRLRRVCARYGRHPVFFLASATAGDPGAAATRLTGLQMAEVAVDASPRGATTFALWEPPLTDLRGEGGAPVRRTATAEAADLLTDLVVDGVRTLAFVRSRRAAETLALTTRSKLQDLLPPTPHPHDALTHPQSAPPRTPTTSTTPAPQGTTPDPHDAPAHPHTSTNAIAPAQPPHGATPHTHSPSAVAPSQAPTPAPHGATPDPHDALTHPHTSTTDPHSPTSAHPTDPADPQTAAPHPEPATTHSPPQSAIPQGQDPAPDPHSPPTDARSAIPADGTPARLVHHSHIARPHRFTVAPQPQTATPDPHSAPADAHTVRAASDHDNGDDTCPPGEAGPHPDTLSGPIPPAHHTDPSGVGTPQADPGQPETSLDRTQPAPKPTTHPTDTDEAFHNPRVVPSSGAEDDTGMPEQAPSAGAAAPEWEDLPADLPSKVAAYRAGYLAEDRRTLEKALRSGELLGLATTNALELGVDVSGLDAVLIAGWPGTRASLWQQAGRAGRDGQDALAVLIARDDPLDTYLVHHPEALFGRPVEAIVLDPDNPYVLGPHLCAAAAEIPLTESDLPIFGPTAPDVIEDLVRQSMLRQRTSGWFWTRRERATDLADIRGSGGAPIQVVETSTGRLLGTVDEPSAHTTVHEGAVYIHQGETFLVDTLDLDEDIALVTAAQPDYTTYARDVTDIAVLDSLRSHPLGSGELHFGTVEVTRQVVSYLKRRLQTGEMLGDEPLDLPPRTLRTRAVWWTLPTALVTPLAEEYNLHIGGAAHAAEHASIGLLPLFATCDRWDIGGVSTELHPDTGLLTVFVYDGHEGGAGFAERGFARAAEWLTATREAIESCECDFGCPSCIQSPKCGNGNEPLDKRGAVRLLNALLTSTP